MMYAAAQWLNGVPAPQKPWGSKEEAQRRVDELNAQGGEWFVAYYNHAMDAWQEVLSAEEFAAAQKMAAERAAAWEAFQAEFGTVAA